MPIDLPEYELAYGEFLMKTTNHLVELEHPVLARIQKVETSGTLDTKVVSADGSEVALPARSISLSHIVEIEPLINGEVSSAHDALREGAHGVGEQMMKLLIDNLGVITDHTGQVVKSSTGKPTWDDVFEGMKACEWTPDEDGIVRPPDTLLLHPDTAAALGDPTPEYVQQMNDLQAQRQEEHDARRRNRRLP